MTARNPARGLLAAAAALLLAPAPASGADREEGPAWGLDLGVHYGYFDRDGRLESRAPGSAAASDPLQLDGTLAGLHGRLRLPTRVAGGQPFLQLSGEFDASDAEDRAGVSGTPGATESSYVALSYQAGVAVDAGLEWQTGALPGDRPLRVRPYAGLGLAFWDAHLDNDRSAVGGGVPRDNDDFHTESARLGLELGLPLVRREAGELDLLLGGRLDLPLGDAGAELETVGGPGFSTRVPGEIELDEAWASYVGLEWRFAASP